MAKPRPDPIDPAQLPELATATIRAAKFPMIATMDGNQPRLRPVSPVRTEGFTVYEAEWWHFDYKDWRTYPIGNSTFEKL